MIREYVESSVCPVCLTDFVSCLRVLAHLAKHTCACRVQVDSRIQSGLLTRVPATKLVELDAADNEARKAARRLGHSHALAAGPARRPDGTIIGRARL